MNVRKRILFFIAGSAPTEAESAAAATLGTKMFRNASQVFSGDTPESCDGVAGKVPVSYAHFPRADAAPSEPAAPVATLNPPDFVKPAAVAAAVVSDDPVAAQRAAEDEGAKSATVAQLKAALAQLGIEIPPGSKKADMLALFLARPVTPPEPAAPSEPAPAV